MTVLQEAAQLRGQSLTDFVVSGAQEAAKRTIEEWQVLSLTQEDRAIVVKTLLDAPPPPPSSARLAGGSGCVLAVEYVVELLSDQHDRSCFAYGTEALDRYLQRQARQDADRNVAVTYVLVR